MATASKTEATPSTPSSGNAALDTLFSGGEGATSQIQDVPAPARQNDVGDFGKLGDMPTTPIEGIQGDNPVDTQSGDPASTAAKAEAKWLEFQVTDDQGKRKMKVDLNNHEQLKRMLPQAAGFRKMQAERDQANSWRKTAEPRLNELESSWQTLETAYQEGGIEGLVDLLGGKQGHYKEWFGGEVAKHQKFIGATEAEKRAMAAEEQVARLTKQQELREKKALEAEKRAATQNEEAQLRSVEAQVTPVFNKYRFAGNVDMPAAQAAAFDQAIWDQALKNLEALPEDQPLTNTQIESEFRKVSAAFKGAIGKQAAAKTRQVLDEKKVEAQTRVAAAAVRGAPGASGNVNQRMQADISKGGLRGLTDGLMHAIRGGR